jgi:hypothetical protein
LSKIRNDVTIPLEKLIQSSNYKEDIVEIVRRATKITPIFQKSKYNNVLSTICQNVYIINMDKSKERLDTMIKELSKYLDGDINVYRFHALERSNNGALGCLLSHAAVLCHARPKENVLILEDDFEFIVTKQKLEERLKAADEIENWDVIVFGQYTKDWGPIGNTNNVMRLYHNTTTSGYLVNHKYIPILRKLWLDLVEKVADNKKLKGIENCDQEQTKLQETGIWLGFPTSIGQQKIIQSTILGGINNSQWVPLPDGKTFRGWNGEEIKLNTRPRYYSAAA